MKRTVKKQFWFSKPEAQDLQKKAKKTCLSEAALVRLLVRGYEPKERPDEKFYDVMRQLSAIGNNINPVSYTHLDVYKRQDICSIIRLKNTIYSNLTLGLPTMGKRWS